MDGKEDERFTHIAKDPRFRSLPNKKRKVIIDERFMGMFTDDRFKLTYTTDKRGRKYKRTTNEDLRQYYHLSHLKNDNGGDREDESETTCDSSRNHKSGSDDEQKLREEKVSEDIDDIVNSGDENNCDYKDMSIRGQTGGRESDSESSSSDSDEDIEESNEVYYSNDIDDGDVERSESTSNRLALCNMNWDRIKADDLFVLLSSVKPAHATIHSVKIFPSEFGKERMQIELHKGPLELVADGCEELDDDVKTGGAVAQAQVARLREYQLQRLRYHYAVVECDCGDTARALYDACDGVEFESSASKLDLRFIPDDMDFSSETATSQCTEHPESNTYNPPQFVTTALHQSHVELTWDEEDPRRTRTLQRDFGRSEVDDGNAELCTYLASSATEDSDSDTHESDKTGSKKDKLARVAKYRQLLLNTGEDKADSGSDGSEMEMEVAWEPGLRQSANQLIPKGQKHATENTAWEKFPKKNNQKKTFNQNNKLNRSGQSEWIQNDADDVPAGIDLNDPYFKEEFENMDSREEVKKKKKTKSETKSDQTLSQDTIKQKDELELLMMEDQLHGENKQHFSLEKIQKTESALVSKDRKRKKRMGSENICDPETEDKFQVDVGDPRFTALYTSHQYNIDPSHPQYKKTQAMESLIEEKMKRRTADSSSAHTNYKPTPTSLQSSRTTATPVAEQKPKVDTETSEIINKIKAKSKFSHVKMQKIK